MSVSTVSRILNNQGNFSEETKKKVFDIVKEHLKPGTTFTKHTALSYSIAVFVPRDQDFYDNDPSTSTDLMNLREEFEVLDHQLSIIANTGKFDSLSPGYDLVMNKKIDAAIVFDPFVGDELVEVLIEQGIPYLVTNGIDEEKNWNYIDYGNRKAAFQVIEYLYRLGHRKIGLLAGPDDHLVNVNRLQGCLDAFKNLDIPIYEGYIRHGSFSPAHGHQAVKLLLTDHPEITAIFAFNDIIAFGAMKGLSELGLSVPEDISLVGFDDLKLSEYMLPPLTTVRRFKYDINHLIARILVELASNRFIDQVKITLNTELIVRQSCREITK